MSASSLEIFGDGSGSIDMDSNGQKKLIPRKKQDKCSSTYIPHNRLSRYTAALANLVPVRFGKVPGSELPLDKIGLFSSVSFSWLNEYISAGYKKVLSDKPLPTIAIQDSCQINGARLDALWHTHIVERGQAGASVPKIAWHFVRTRVLISSAIYFIGMLIALCSPILVLHKIITATEDRIKMLAEHSNISIDTNKLISLNASNFTVNNSSNSPGNSTDNFQHLLLMDEIIIFTNIGILVIAEITSHFLTSWSASMNLRTATRLKSACLALAYKKLLRSSIRFKAPVYQTLTYYVPDSKTLYEFITNGPLIFSGPIVLLLSSLFIWYSMGHWALIGVIVMITLYLGFILNAYLTNKFATSAMHYSLKRLSLLEEFIGKIHLAKITQRDRCFISRIHSIRKNEIREIKFGAISEGCSLFMVHVIPIVSVSAMTMAYLLTHEFIDSANYIPCFVLIFLHLKHCIRSSWLAMCSISHGVASLNKLKSVLILKDADRFTDKPIDKNFAITINCGHFSWDCDQSSLEKSIRHTSYFVSDNDNLSCLDNQVTNTSSELIDINFYVSKGRLVGICGASGSGKTSLLLSIMGQLNRVNGQVTIDGTLSYVSEAFCLLEGTFKENIVMEEPFDSTLYYKTIQACNLNTDISLLPGSDDTDISTVDLSASQKQKIAFARAVYTNKDIILLDNPLKDVDLNESLEIFEKSLKILGNKTIIMISDKIQFLTKCDVVYMMKQGKIVDQGKHDDLRQWNKEYEDLVNSFEKKYQEIPKTPVKNIIRMKSFINSGASTHNLGSISHVDKDPENSVGTSMYWGIAPRIDCRPYKNDKGKCLSEFVCGLSLFYSIPIAAAPLIFFYIAQKTLTTTTYIAIILASLAVFIVVCGLFLIIMYNKDVFNAAKTMHDRWLQSIYRAHISVFSAISSSAIINICTHDMQEVDYALPKLKITALMHIGISIISAVILTIVCPWLLIPILLFIAGIIGYKIYVRQIILTLDELKIESITPIYSHMVNTVNERIIIQAYRKDREFARKFYKYCNINAAYNFMLEATKLWFEYRVKIFSVFTLMAVMVICAALSSFKDRYEVLGLAFICTLQLTQSIVHLSRAIIDAYGSLMSIGFVENYIQNIPQEKKDSDDQRRDWPSAPNIHFQNVLLTSSSTDYEPLNFSIYAGDKVEIHTNDRIMKRDVVNALLKFEEVFSGNILVGNVNINDIHIDKLRRYVNYIPGTPVLFDGTIRYNLEITVRKSNEEIMAALQQVLLWEKISKLKYKLDNDANNIFSRVEKKLLFLARIYLNSPFPNRSIIIIEDLEPDPSLIENILQDVFKEFTIIVMSNKSHSSSRRVIELQSQKGINISKISHSSETSDDDLLI
ncbi:multidrug resistance-associated protein 9-like isoform X2 [Chelonus insularis]|uniref:multidrug resistance-associated protein 9-like isoform X2 n=1 Tax=Chelonus insularis TaxID=460826 RepID=UPI00158EA872|nr:multidrug resistance-associated protein 9-like isoform X2 [Chelonus insularis]